MLSAFKALRQDEKRLLAEYVFTDSSFAGTVCELPRIMSDFRKRDRGEEDETYGE